MVNGLELLTWHFNGVHQRMDLLTWPGAFLPLPDLAFGGCRYGLRLDGLTDVESFCRSGLEDKLPTSHVDLMCGQFCQFQMEVKLKCGNAYFNCYLAMWVWHADQARSPSCWRLDLLTVKPTIHAQTGGSNSRLSQEVGDSLGSAPIDKSLVPRGS
ncbi:hypothetical protein Nepgr_033673 [Nepenthes gracilis]|uniref:Uncharacterized protein n=1 Tax=Nepenthes gracilis TaxID=150966 RepID=A0AAD3Y8T9_NEPGR|nr:hypothetical protein Nepgr_033673 [Nepenthes gracilis]